MKSDRVGDQEKAKEELQTLDENHRTDEERYIFRFDDGDFVDYRLEPDTTFAAEIPADHRGYKPITWTQLKKKFCYERTAHKFKIIGDVSCKDMTHWERSKSVKVRDADGVEGAVFFYDEESKPYFEWENLSLGSEMEILSPRFHKFMDGQDGMRLESNKSIGYVRKRSVTDAMRIDYGRQNKDAGNKLFAEKKYDNALAAYDQALNQLEGTFKQSPELEPTAKSLAAACYLNIAAVRIAERKWNLVEMPCERALNINANAEMNAKAYFRLGQAFMEQGLWVAAGDKLLRAQELAPHDPRVAEELKKLSAIRNECKESQKALFATARKNQRSDFGFRENLLVEAPSSLDGVSSFRDLGGLPSNAHCALRTRMLYRSSNFMDATKSDLIHLQDPFGIKTIVDLRNDRESSSYEKSVRNRLIENDGDANAFVDIREKFYPLTVSCGKRTARIQATPASRRLLQSNWNLLCRKYESIGEGAAIPGRNSDSEIDCVLQHCRVIVGLDMATRSILSLLSWWRLVIVFFLGAIGMIQLASKMVVRNTAQRVGPLQLYLTFLDQQRPEIRFLFADVFPVEKNYPLVVSCSLGKDRTGVVVALLLSVCGVSEEVIADDYAKTGELLSTSLKEMNSSLGLGAEWSETRKDVMLAFLSELRQRHGGAHSFLETIGVPAASLQRIREILVCKKKGK